MTKASIRKEKKRLLEEMEKVDPESPRYAKLSTELEKLSKAENSQNGWLVQAACGVFQTVITSVASSVNVWKVLKHEDKGNIVTTKSLNYAPKPTEHAKSVK